MDCCFFNIFTIPILVICCTCTLYNALNVDFLENRFVNVYAALI